MLHYFKMGSADEPIDLRMPYFFPYGFKRKYGRKLYMWG